jgi:GH24 family phage-related lysozyme (muramidase)
MMSERPTETTLDELEGSNVRPDPPYEEAERAPRGEESEAGVEAEPPDRAGRPTRLSRKGAAFVARFEGCILHLYDDPAGHCTIGIGHLVHHGRCDGREPAEFKSGITRERAFELLQQDAAEVAKAVVRHVTVPLKQHQFDALCSFGFNCGTGAIATSTLTRRLNAGEFAAVPHELNRWVKAGGQTLPGLVRRRKAEGQLFARGKYG